MGRPLIPMPQRAASQQATLARQVKSIQARLDVYLPPPGSGEWQDIPLDSGWTAGPQVPQYQLAGDGTVQVRGQATCASITAVTPLNSGSPLAASFQPAVTRYYRASDPMDGAGAVQIDGTGVFSVRASSAYPATQAILDGFYSL